MITDTDYVLRGALGYATIRDFAQAHPDLSGDTAAELMVAPMTIEDLRTFARCYVSEQIDMWRRYEARKIEEAAQRAGILVTPPVRTEPNYLERYRDDPTAVPLNLRERKAFRRWMGDSFESWREAAREQVRALDDDRALDLFDADWHPDGVQAFYREQLVSDLTRHVNAMARTIRLEITRELLATQFALGNGERVTWGSATVEQHQQRISLLMTNAAANMETAARHTAAVEMIEQADATCLGELGQLAA